VSRSIGVEGGSQAASAVRRPVSLIRNRREIPLPDCASRNSTRDAADNFLMEATGPSKAVTAIDLIVQAAQAQATEKPAADVVVAGDAVRLTFFDVIEVPSQKLPSPLTSEFPGFRRELDRRLREKGLEVASVGPGFRPDLLLVRRSETYQEARANRVQQAQQRIDALEQRFRWAKWTLVGTVPYLLGVWAGRNTIDNLERGWSASIDAPYGARRYC
jgi:hypothetical protein